MTALVGYVDLSARLGIPVGTLRSMVARRQIPHMRIGPRIVRFNLGEIDAWLASKAVTP